MNGRYLTEDEYFEALADAHDRADQEAMEHAEAMADLSDWDSEADRNAYIDTEYFAEYERLCEAYEKAL